MAKGGSHKIRGGSHRRRGGSHRRRGGSNKMRGGNYSSAASYGGYINGTTDAQLNRVFSENGNNSNVIIGAQGQNAGYVNQPSESNLNLIQNGGRRGKKGGLLNLGPVITQGIVPFAFVALNHKMPKIIKGKTGGSAGLDLVPVALLGMQQMYGKTRKNR